ncbi:MAG: hypothetical protein A2X34_05735 [Elusimicrobia bacterium GWC2_51_8]|nr:MAG: hypothetical protein A2X33_09510 [Elusimicrobia bacterium GWA2_51_34]OGR58450.1 MAG: hypothetical protein A2X34_05735 [Elusimicrobia bacterium GWC2_51_8]HCE98083.1 hypothetical protein [Elusimicrobiota bacterium]
MAVTLALPFSVKKVEEELEIFLCVMGAMAVSISGGLLIPGNIANTISSAKLGTKSGEWAGAAIPYGAALMLSYFIALTIFVK